MPRRPAGEDVAILERRKNVARRRIRGELEWEIARAFELDERTIRRDVRAIKQIALGEIEVSGLEIIAAEYQQVLEVRREAWAAWKKSQENAETLRARMRGKNADGSPIDSSTEKISKGQAGDGKFLEIILKCDERICKLFGIEDVPRDKDGVRLEIVEEIAGDAEDNPKDSPPAPQAASVPPEPRPL